MNAVMTIAELPPLESEGEQSVDNLLLRLGGFIAGLVHSPSDAFRTDMVDRIEVVMENFRRGYASDLAFRGNAQSMIRENQPLLEMRLKLAVKTQATGKELLALMAALASVGMTFDSEKQEWLRFCVWNLQNHIEALQGDLLVLEGKLAA